MGTECVWQQMSVVNDNAGSGLNKDCTLKGLQAAIEWKQGLVQASPSWRLPSDGGKPSPCQ